MISSELPEILRMSHRIVVMSEGRVTGSSRRRGHAGERHASRDAAAGREPRGRGRARAHRGGRQSRRRGRTAETQEQRTPVEAVHRPLRDKLQQFLAFASLIAIFLFFSIASSSFLNYDNVTAILFSTVVIGLLALGTTFVIITGGIDLSIGTGMTLCAVISGVLITKSGLPVAGRRHRRRALRRADRAHQRLQRLDPRYPALHRDAGDDAGRPGAGAGALRQHADLLHDSPGSRRSRRATCSA